MSKWSSIKSQLVFRIVLLFGILILVNIISIRIFGRLDLTKQKVFTLSHASRNLVQNLDDRVIVKAYFSEDLPAPYNGNRRAVLDILNEYKAYSKGNVQYEFIDPDGEKGEQEAQQQGIMPVQVQVVEDDKLEVKRGFLGLVMLYEDKKETLPVIQNLATLEFDISSALKRLTTRSKKRIGFSTGHDEPPLSELKQASQNLAGQYELVPVDLTSGSDGIDNIDALLIISPEKKFSEEAKETINAYIMKGGKVAFLLNRMKANLQTQFAQPLELGLEELLEKYGIRINQDLVRDAQCANVSVVQQQGSFMMQSQVPYVYLPVASGFNSENVIVKNLQSIIFHFVSSIDTALAGVNNIKVEVLVESSNKSGRNSGFMQIDPFQRFTSVDLAEQRIPLAVSFAGSFKSSKPEDGSRSPDTRIIVVGDGDFMKDDFAGNRGNLTFFANIVDYLADDAGLITIRSKNIAMPPLDQVSDGTKKLLKYGNMVLPSVLIIGYGLFRWRRRIAMKRALELQS